MASLPLPLVLCKHSNPRLLCAHINPSLYHSWLNLVMCYISNTPQIFFSFSFFSVMPLINDLIVRRTPVCEGNISQLFHLREREIERIATKLSLTLTTVAALSLLVVALAHLQQQVILVSQSAAGRRCMDQSECATTATLSTNHNRSSVASKTQAPNTWFTQPRFIIIWKQMTNIKYNNKQLYKYESFKTNKYISIRRT